MKSASLHNNLDRIAWTLVLEPSFIAPTLRYVRNEDNFKHSQKCKESYSSSHLKQIWDLAKDKNYQSSLISFSGSVFFYGIDVILYIDWSQLIPEEITMREAERREVSDGDWTNAQRAPWIKVKTAWEQDAWTLPINPGCYGQLAQPYVGFASIRRHMVPVDAGSNEHSPEWFDEPTVPPPRRESMHA